jgi:hypothetical protein
VRIAQLGLSAAAEVDAAEMFPSFIESTRRLADRRCAAGNSR